MCKKTLCLSLLRIVSANYKCSLQFATFLPLLSTTYFFSCHLAANSNKNEQQQRRHRCHSFSLPIWTIRQSYVQCALFIFFYCFCALPLSDGSVDLASATVTVAAAVLFSIVLFSHCLCAFFFTNWFHFSIVGDKTWLNLWLYIPLTGDYENNLIIRPAEGGAFFCERLKANPNRVWMDQSQGVAHIIVLTNFAK